MPSHRKKKRETWGRHQGSPPQEGNGRDSKRKSKFITLPWWGLERGSIRIWWVPLTKKNPCIVHSEILILNSKRWNISLHSYPVFTNLRLMPSASSLFSFPLLQSLPDHQQQLLPYFLTFFLLQHHDLSVILGSKYWNNDSTSSVTFLPPVSSISHPPF